MASLSSVSSSSIGKENANENPPSTGMLTGLQQLEKRIIATTSTTQIIDIIGCDITIEDIQLGKQELINQRIDLKKDVNKRQELPIPYDFFHSTVTAAPLILFCWTGNLLIIKLLFLIGADCTQLCKENYWFPLFVAAKRGHLDVCKWLFEYGGDAKYQINTETIHGATPLFNSYIAWQNSMDKKGTTCRWLLRNGGGQHLSRRALHNFIDITGEEDIDSNLLVLWTREKILLHDTFILFLCGAYIMIAPSSLSLSLSEPNDDGTRTRPPKRKRKTHQERSLQILDGHPGIMELIGDYSGLIRGIEFRMLKEFNELFIDYINTYGSNSDDDDDNDNTEDY